MKKALNAQKEQCGSITEANRSKKTCFKQFKCVQERKQERTSSKLYTKMKKENMKFL